MNTYAYVESDPLNWADPLGLAKYTPKNTDEAWCLRYPTACKELRKDLYDLLKKPKKPKVSGKEGAKDCPSWVKQDGGPLHNESGKDYAKRMMDDMYGEGGWSDTGPTSEFNQIKKMGGQSIRVIS